MSAAEPRWWWRQRTLDAYAATLELPERTQFWRRISAEAAASAAFYAKIALVFAAVTVGMGAATLLIVAVLA